MSERVPIVYVEDNEANLVLVQRVLEATGRYRVVGVRSGRPALAEVLATRPKVVLLDLDLPDIAGLDVARAIRADTSLEAMPILVVSASVMRHERREATRAGCDGFMEKPFDIGELRAEVDRLVREGRQRA